MRNLALCASWLALAAISPTAAAEEELAIGSKKFTESVILGEVMTQLAKEAGVRAIHRRELGGTRVLWNALQRGEIDAYPEYTGTISQEILGGQSIGGDAAIRAALEPLGIRMSQPLGFDNTYAIGMQESVARASAIRTISDLRAHPDLRLGFTNEFMDRQDGWPLLRDRYALPQQDVRGLDHDLAYRGLQSGVIDAVDLYSTDAEIRYYGIRVLEDDRGVFPEYRAVLLYRKDLADRAPDVTAAWQRLVGSISEETMTRMNASVKIEGQSEPRVASRFLAEALGVDTEVRETTALERLAKNTRDHLVLVGISLSAAILIAVPLGIWAARRPRAGQLILGIVGIIQTIPALALLVFMIPLLGIGGPPAIMALFLYSLLPIVRNTYSGLHDIPLHVHESARALGLPPRARLRHVELPMASRSILAGIKTSAVINIGFATLGALIGAGGYGQPILTGIRLDDTGLILEGAIPAALLALLAQGAFEVIERLVVPEGLCLREE